VWASRMSGKTIDLWIANGDGSSRRRLTFDDESDEKWPDASPDGRTVVYVRDTTGSAIGDIWRVSTDGTAPPVRLTTTADAALPHVMADGQHVVFNRAINGVSYAFEAPLNGGEV